MKLTIGAAALLSLNATATVARSPFHVLGIGNETCQTWTRTESHHGPSWIQGMAWLNGFLSGANMLNKARGQGNVTRDADTFEHSMSFIRRYCVEHPRDPASLAAQHLVIHMLDRAQGI